MSDKEQATKVSNYKPDERITIYKLIEADAPAFVALAEKAGYLSTAFHYHAHRHHSWADLEHALELAKRLKRIPSKTLANVITDLEKEYDRILSAGPGLRGEGGMREAYAQLGYERRQKEYKQKKLDLEETARESGFVKSSEGKYIKLR